MPVKFFEKFFFHVQIIILNLAFSFDKENIIFDWNFIADSDSPWPNPYWRKKRSLRNSIFKEFYKENDFYAFSKNMQIFVAKNKISKKFEFLIKFCTKMLFTASKMELFRLRYDHFNFWNVMHPCVVVHNQLIWIDHISARITPFLMR
jgi:hypothetical protein